MKISTATIYGMIWVLPATLVAQGHDANPPKIRQVKENNDKEIGLREDALKVAQNEGSAMALELVRLRMLIAEEEKKKLSGDPWSGDLSEKVLNRLKYKEAALASQLDWQHSYISLLEKTMYWPGPERELALMEFVEQPSGARAIPSEWLEEESGRTIDKRIYQAHLPIFDLLENPPIAICQSVDRSHDPGQKSSIKQTAPQLLFGHTDQNLEIHFLKRDFISGYASLALEEGGVKALDLHIAVASPKAHSIYGGIRQQDKTVITFLDGTELALRPQLPSKGQWDVTTQSFQYNCRYLIGIREERLLRKNEVDKISVGWSKVQDEYEIFEVDFFKNQFDCLENGY